MRFLPVPSFLSLFPLPARTQTVVREVPCHFDRPTRYMALGDSLAAGYGAEIGIGSGALKVLAMDMIMRLPFKVSTTTSNFMIGVTAAASAGVYLRRGYADDFTDQRCQPDRGRAKLRRDGLRWNQHDNERADRLAAIAHKQDAGKNPGHAGQAGSQ